MHANKITDINETLDKKRIYRCTNRTKIMSEAQYIVYCRKLGVKSEIRKSINRRVKLIGGTKRRIGTAMIQIKFKDFDFVIDVEFFLLAHKTLNLLSMYSMVDSGIELSIQESMIKLEGLRQ